MTNFEEVKKLVQNGKLRILSVSSPSRTVSSILSKSINAHPDVAAEVLQPFHLRHPYSPGENREEQAYGLLLEAYDELSRTTPEKPLVIIVAKEMARNLMNPETLKGWDAVSAKHIITIRNPLLAIESVLRLNFNFIEQHPEGLAKTAKEFAETNELEQTPEYFRNFHNVYAKNLGYEDKSGLGQHWRVLARHAMEHRDYTMIAPLLMEFFPFHDINSRLDNVKIGYIGSMNDETAKQAGYKSLDDFAKTVGNRNWKELVKDKLGKSEGLEVFAPLLNVIFSTSNTGWEGLRNLLLFSGADSRIQIIDGSTLRAAPDSTVNAICEHLALDIKHAGVMIDWGDIQKKVFERMEPVHKAAFVRAQASTKLELPIETPILPSRFPKQFCDHFLQVAMPQYIQALCDDRCIRPKGKDALSAMLGKKASDGQTLQQIDPVWAYSLVSTDNLIAPDDKNEMLENIRKGAPSFKEVFDLIDRINKDRLLVKRGGSVKTAQLGAGGK